MARRYLAAITVGLITFAVIGTTVMAGDDAPAPIRAFDIPTIESLGRQMYLQDQEAWKATDIFRAQHSQEEMKDVYPHGWIVDSLPGRDVVRFIREGASGPEAFFDVIFAGDAAPTTSEPQERTLTPEELAQHKARRLAIDNAEMPCTENYNTIALKDPQQPGWLVWVMAATSNPNVYVMGRHYRFAISLDGTSVRQKDTLTKGCLIISKGDPQRGKSVGFIVSHLVSITPIETHVFASFSYKTDVYVGTIDGQSWKISQGHMTTVEPDAPYLDGLSARLLLGRAELCTPIIAISGDGKHGFRLGSVMKITESLESEDKIALDAPSGDSVVGIICGRRDIIPLPNDYKVLLSGYELRITDFGEGHPKRMGKLSMSEGKFQYDITVGDPLTDDLNTRLTRRLTEFQEIIQKKP